MDQDIGNPGPSFAGFVDEFQQNVDSHYRDYMNLFSLWSDDSSWLEENPLVVPQPLQSSQRVGSSSERLPVEILCKVVDLTVIHKVNNDTEMALACRYFKNIWDSRSRNIYEILTQSVGEAVLASAVLAVQVIYFAKNIASKKHKSCRVRVSFKKRPAQRFILLMDVPWRMAHEI